MIYYGHSAYRRRLPHYQNDYRSYFVTFRTWNRFVLPDEARDIVLRHIVDFPSYSLHETVVMPDHVHLIATPHLGDEWTAVPLWDILRKIKGASSRRVNQQLGRRGRLWQDESFDHELRNDESLAEKCEYIRQNPVRKGLVTHPDDYPWLWPKGE